MEAEILGAMMQARSAYETFESIGDASLFGPLGSLVARSIKDYYECDSDAQSCSRELLESRLLRDVKNPKHEDTIKRYLDDLPESTSVPNVEREIRELHKQKVGGRLSLALANGAPSEEVARLIGEYEKAGEPGANSDPAEDALVDVLDTTDLTEEGSTNVDYIKLWPRQLNDRLDGGVLRGHHVLVFARPETGKTLFCINLVAGFLHQKLNVLYVGNEEPAADIRDRIRGRLLKVSKNEIRHSREVSARRLAEADIGKLRILSNAGSFAEVRNRLVEDDYGVVVLDQIRNMRMKSDSRTAELEAAGIEARAIAKEFNVLVVSVTQAGDSATGKVFLEMSDVDSSKTGIPASADLMIGIGCDEAMKVNGLLGLSLCKNKLSGSHDKFTVSVNFSTGVIE